MPRRCVTMLMLCVAAAGACAQSAISNQQSTIAPSSPRADTLVALPKEGIVIDAELSDWDLSHGLALTR